MNVPIPCLHFLARAAGCALILAVAVAAQPSTQSLAIGGGGARGCQGPQDPPLLSDGTLATGTLDFTYDARTSELSLVVANTSPVTSGVANPLITRIAFNLPHEAVTGVTLLAQTGSGGAAPAFEVEDDADVFHAPDLRVACMGNFGVLLSTNPHGEEIRGGIGNPLADTYPVPPASVVIGPVTFRLRLQGPGVASLNAPTLAQGFSRSAPAYQVNAMCKFQGAGPSRTGGGFISSTVANVGCRPTTWLGGVPRIGSTVSICLNGQPGCAGAFIGSLFKGPVIIGPFRIPIGLPLLFDVFVPPLLPNTLFCFDFDIPDDPSLIGRSIYIAVATPGSTLDDFVDFSPRVNVTFIQ